jgi:hypothetical protein
MTRFPRVIFCAAGALLMAAGAAGSPADKVTGEFMHLMSPECPPVDEQPAYGKEMSAHESIDGRMQKGFIYIYRPDGTWNYIDLGNAANACVNVYENDKARVGGLNIDGTGPGIGRYFGWELEDHGEPGACADLVTGLRFPETPEGRLDFLEWCATGDRTGSTAVWPHVMIEGNLQIHNHAADGD